MVNVEAFIYFSVKYIGTEETHHRTPVTWSFLFVRGWVDYVMSSENKYKVNIISYYSLWA